MEHENVIVMSPEYTRAMKLDRHIKTHAQMAQESLYEVCKGLKEMRDGKLYKELGYQNFVEYCENEVGIKKVQAYKYVSIAENLSSKFVQSTEQIGTEKLALLAKLDESNREQVMQEVDVESVTYRELQAVCDQSKAKIQELEDKQKQSESALQKKQDEIIKLESQIQELENRPVDVYHSEEDKQEIERLTVQNEALEEQCTELEQKIYAYESQEQTQPEKSPEYQNLMKAMHNNSHEWAEKYDALQEKSWQEMNELKRTHQVELERVRQESMKAPNNSDACLALAQSAHDAVSRLKRFLEAHPGASLYSAMYFKTVIERLVDIEAEQVEKGNVS
ncbi:MAG: hypothetical protein K2H29_07335 [Oscillospiraceae bacterium]|nr:hypothetical protein [Oscillospiraceae bacterium]